MSILIIQKSKNKVKLNFSEPVGKSYIRCYNTNIYNEFHEGGLL